ncbi:hypothetical protein [Streptomyces sp. CA-251251]|uniref:hypothetical protein n=1 Tax=Streptomyces sp. CA-251251 TaxID=3240063 RepID=UPI003D89CA7A
MGVADGPVPEFRQPAHEFGPPPHLGRRGAAPGGGEQVARPVGAAGEQGLLGRGRVPLGPRRAVGRQLGGTGVRRGAQPVGGGRRIVGGDLRQPVRERGFGGRTGQGPGAVQQRREPVAPGLQHVGQRAVRGTAPVRCGGGVDGAADQRPVEPEPLVGQGEGFGEGVHRRSRRGSGPQVPYGVEGHAGVDVRRVRRPGGSGHRQQQVPRVGGRVGQRRAGDRREAPGVDQRGGQGPVPAQLGGRQPADEGEEQGRVPLRPGQQLLADRRIGGAVGHVVEQGVGLRPGEGVEADDGEVGELRVDGAVSGD